MILFLSYASLQNYCYQWCMVFFRWLLDRVQKLTTRNFFEALPGWPDTATIITLLLYYYVLYATPWPDQCLLGFSKSNLFVAFFGYFMDSSNNA